MDKFLKPAVRKMYFNLWSNNTEKPMSHCYLLYPLNIKRKPRLDDESNMSHSNFT